MKICCVSDLHGYLPSIPDCDLLLIGGDILPMKIQNDIPKSVGWLNGSFREWLNELFNRGIRTIGIAGNHDFIFERASHLVPRDLLWMYLQDSGVEMSWRHIKKPPITIWGTPWQPYFGGWAFNAYENELENKWEMIPDKTDILIVHGSPYMHGDMVFYIQNGEGVEEHVGSPSLTRRIEQVKPKLVCCGHVHEGYGLYDCDGIVIANASLVNERYQPVNEPIIVEI